jgi:hypothetical protein
MRALLDDLTAAGVQLHLDGDRLHVVPPAGVSLDPYRERIMAHKPELLVELLQRRIVAVVDVEPTCFDRAEYDRLWTLWKAHDPAGETP